MKKQCLLTIGLLMAYLCLFAQKATKEITIGHQYKIDSELLMESRSYNVYLPPGYENNTQVRYPVIYMIDGDYNFHHISGLVEQLASISEKIPEMIVVGICDKGNANYKKNCTLYDEKNNPSGRAETFLSFLTQELKIHIDKTYRTADQAILAGHSIGGLFVVNSLLKAPKSFDAYIAISPSLWHTDYGAAKEVKSFFEKHDNIDRFLFISVANEIGMGVLGFVDELDIHTYEDLYYGKKPLGLEVHFQNFPEENHGSLGWISVNNALKLLYENYDVPASFFIEMTTFLQYENIMLEYAKMVGDGFKFPKGHLKNIIRALSRNNKDELEIAAERIRAKFPASHGDYLNTLGSFLVKNEMQEKGLGLLKQNCQQYPDVPEYLTSLGNAYFDNGQITEAKICYQKALEVGEKTNVRNWYLNQLSANLEKTK